MNNLRPAMVTIMGTEYKAMLHSFFPITETIGANTRTTLMAIVEFDDGSAMLTNAKYVRLLDSESVRDDIFKEVRKDDD